MVKCLICEKEFKNGAGLSGHTRFSHPSAVAVDGHKVEQRLDMVEENIKSLSDMISRLLSLSQTFVDNTTQNFAGIDMALYLHLKRQHQIKLNSLFERLPKEYQEICKE